MQESIPALDSPSDKVHRIKGAPEVPKWHPAQVPPLLHNFNSWDRLYTYQIRLLSYSTSPVKYLDVKKADYLTKVFLETLLALRAQSGQIIDLLDIERVSAQRGQHLSLSEGSCESSYSADFSCES